MNCQKCGAQNDDQAAFCDKCGATLQRPPVGSGAGTTEPAYPEATQYAGFWKRAGAFVIDLLIMYAVQTVIMVILILAGVIDMDAVEAGPDSAEYGHVLAVSYALSGAMAIVLIIYSTIMEASSRRATLGKMVLGIVVTDADGKRVSLGRAIGRNLGKIISSIIWPIYIVAAFTEKKQAVHDMIAKCLVVVKK